MTNNIKEKYKAKRPPERARKDDETDEQYARYVLNYMAENRDFILKSVKKNITNDEELLEDVFSDTCVLVYDNLIKHPKALESVCDWVFLALKLNFITAQKKKRKENANKVEGFSFNEIEDDTDWRAKEDRLNRTSKFLEWCYEQLEEEFGSEVSNTWIIYYRLKSEKPSSISYAKLAGIMQVSPNVISQRIQACKRWFKENEEILRIRFNNYINS